MSRRTISPTRRGAALCLLLALAACAPTAAEFTATETPKQLRVDYGRRGLVLAFAPGSAVLAPGEAARLAEFLGRAGIDEADRVSLGAPASAGALGLQRLQAVAAVLRNYGLVAAVGSAPPAALVPDQVSVEIGRYVVTTPACPNWSRPPGADLTNGTSSNFGCATALNLGMMVADPGDLLHGRGHGAFDAEPATLAIQRYRTDKTTPLNLNTQLPIGAAAAGAPPAPTPAAAPAAAAPASQ